jgi:hypothetical protein
MRVTMNDGRQMVGQMLAFDKVCAILGYQQVRKCLLLYST